MDNVIPFPTHRMTHVEEVEIDTHDGVDGMATAVFDQSTRQYRYLLTRQWGPGVPLVFLMLNPSTADAFVLDPTVRRCIGFAKREGFGAVVVLNIFALRSRHPRVLYDHADPVGPLNDDYLRRMTRNRTVVCAWGGHGAHQQRGAQVARMLADLGRNLVALHTTKDGHPGHPLYLRADAPLAPYAPR